MKSSKQIAMGVGVLAALALPSTALAQHGADDSTSEPNQVQTGVAQPRTEAYELRGSVISLDAASDSVVVQIKKANHGRRGRRLVGQQVTLDLTGARLQVRDVNGDGVRDINDVAAGDAVEARVRLPRSQAADLSQPLAASRFKDRAKRASDDPATHA